MIHDPTNESQALICLWQARYNWMEARRREGGGERERDRPLYRQAALPGEEETKPRVERLAVVDNVLMYRGDRGLPGLYISGQSSTPSEAGQGRVA